MFDAGTDFEVCPECGNKTVMIGCGFCDACGVDHNDPPMTHDAILPSRSFCCLTCLGDGYVEDPDWFRRPREVFIEVGEPTKRCAPCRGTGRFIPRWRAGLADPLDPAWVERGIPLTQRMSDSLAASEAAYVEHLFGPSKLDQMALEALDQMSNASHIFILGDPA